MTPGLRELTALGFITRTRDIKRSTFMLSDQWQNVATQREALLISVNARVPPRIANGASQRRPMLQPLDKIAYPEITDDVDPNAVVGGEMCL